MVRASSHCLRLDTELAYHGRHPHQGALFGLPSCSWLLAYVNAVSEQMQQMLQAKCAFQGQKPCCTGLTNCRPYIGKASDNYCLDLLGMVTNSSLRARSAQPLEQAPEGTLAHYGLDLGVQLYP